MPPDFSNFANTYISFMLDGSICLGVVRKKGSHASIFKLKHNSCAGPQAVFLGILFQ